MISTQYLWLAFSLIFGFGWAIFYTFNPKLRRPMTVIGILIAPTTAFQFFYMKDYWNPPSVFPIFQKVGLDIESFLWTFFAPGISLAAYSLSSGRSIYRARWKLVAYLYSLGLTGFLMFYFGLGVNSINAAITGMVFGILGGALVIKPDIKAGLISSLVFLAFYLVSFVILNAIDPLFVRTFWRIENVSGIFILNIPLEEILFGFFGGIFFVLFSEAVVQKENRSPTDVIPPMKTNRFPTK